VKNRKPALDDQNSFTCSYDKLTKTKRKAVFVDYKQFEAMGLKQNVRSYIDNKLVQVESYHDCKFNSRCEDGLFDSLQFIKRQLP